jgi:hypothetical protein
MIAITAMVADGKTRYTCAIAELEFLPVAGLPSGGHILFKAASRSLAIAPGNAIALPCRNVFAEPSDSAIR